MQLTKSGATSNNSAIVRLALKAEDAGYPTHEEIRTTSGYSPRKAKLVQILDNAEAMIQVEIDPDVLPVAKLRVFVKKGLLYRFKYYI